MPGDAHHIYQDFLDTVSEALWARDFDKVAAHKAYPHITRGVDGQRDEKDHDELVDCVRSYRESLTGLGATAYHRVCLEAAFDADDDARVTGRHQTYILRGGSYVAPPYECRMVLIRSGDKWVCPEITVPFRCSLVRRFDPGALEDADRRKNPFG